jgi:hypothetical protein
MQAGRRPSEATERRVKAIKSFAASAQYEGELYKLYAGMWEATRAAEDVIGRNQKDLSERLEAHQKRYQELLRRCRRRGVRGTAQTRRAGRSGSGLSASLRPSTSSAA